jgi:hypothetical protein
MTEARNGGNLTALTEAYHDREDDEDEEDFRFRSQKSKDIKIPILGYVCKKPKILWYSSYVDNTVRSELQDPFYVRIT